MTEESKVRKQVRAWLADVEVKEAMEHENLTVFPLIWRSDSVPAREDTDPTWPEVDTGRYRLLMDAIAAKDAQVEEGSEGGEVPFLGVENKGGTPILIPEGEILIGAKQNRVVNLTVLVAAHTTFKLPVSCVERGRWHYRSREFEPAAFAHPKLRDLKVRSAQQNRRTMGLAMADQGQVWDEVDLHLSDMAVASPTRDFFESLDGAEESLQGFRNGIVLPEEACGFIVARSGWIVGLDLFDSAETMGKLWRRMSDAYFLEAARLRGERHGVTRESATAFLDRVVDRLEASESQPDLGVELEVVDEGISGSALFYEGAVCHLSAFNSAETS